MSLIPIPSAVRGRVLLFGDSNVLRSAVIYEAVLYSGNALTLIDPAPAFLCTFAAVAGSALADSAAWATALEEICYVHTFDAAVVQLGVNDTVTGACTGNLADHIDDIVEAVPDIPIIVLDTPYTSDASHSYACQVTVNLAWQAAITRHSPRLTYINTNQALTDASLTYPSAWYVDGLHYSLAAQFVLAEQVRVALEAVL